MRTYINARLARVLMVGIFSLSWAFATADCTFGNFSASSNPFAGCSGKITITGTFSIDQDYNVSALPITELIIRGTLVFTANKDLILPTNTILRLEGGGSINTGSPCSNSKRIVIGSTVASCVGASSNFSFDQLNLTGWFSNLGPLPITLTNFEAKPGPSSVSLTWRTASELNNDYLIVERSANGTDFAALVRIKGLGTTDGPQDYQFSDHTPLAGINYYRLRQVDFDGTTEIHPTVSVLFNGETQLGLSAFPNPASSVLPGALGRRRRAGNRMQTVRPPGKTDVPIQLCPGNPNLRPPLPAPGARRLRAPNDPGSEGGKPEGGKKVAAKSYEVAENGLRNLATSQPRNLATSQLRNLATSLVASHREFHYLCAKHCHGHSCKKTAVQPGRIFQNAGGGNSSGRRPGRTYSR
ncbi:MAG: hypothetical protein IPK21_16750 [Haliscomenobacter sp.]|nr:hypothetical protein [Haliscomenobacter sp.]